MMLLKMVNQWSMVYTSSWIRKDEAHLSYDPLDDTKVWDEQTYPLIPVGKMVLNKNPENFMEQVEKVAFSPSNLLDGAELSDDKMPQGRANIYSDSQRRRIGPEFRKLTINQHKIGHLLIKLQPVKEGTLKVNLKELL